MLRITVSTSGRAATAYFNAELSRGDYYAEKGELAGIWQGRGAALLGLEGQVVEREAFAALASNRDPTTGEQLTPRLKDNRRAGYDFTFSAPKSVSVLREYLLETGREAQAAELVAGFERAVGDSMAELEADMRVRLRAKGQRGDAVTGTMVWAGFTHFQSRPVDGWADPHLHRHAFAMNLTHDGTGWKAGEFGAIKRDAVYYQEAFHARLAAELKGQGYDVEASARDFELAGIGRETVAKFSRRTAEVEADAKNRGVQSEGLKSTLGARTRAQKDEGLPAEETRARNMARLSETERQAFERLASREDEPPPAMTAREGVDYAIAHVFERQSTCDEKRLAAEALKAGAGAYGPEQVWRELQGRADVLRARVGDRSTVTTRAALEEEATMLRLAQDGRGQAI
ncbi:MAG: relaxase domain-containing protein, partial [Myxococcales bacterium]|nr:relaxase domain-containing protein [Myxococcales bacterium]